MMLKFAYMREEHYDQVLCIFSEFKELMVNNFQKILGKVNIILLKHIFHKKKCTSVLFYTENLY